MLDRRPSQDRRVKYDPELIRATESAPRRFDGARRPFYRDINGGAAMAAATGSIKELAKILKEVVTPDDSADDINELPRELILNIGERSSAKPVFITNTPYRPKPAD